DDLGQVAEPRHGVGHRRRHRLDLPHVDEAHVRFVDVCAHAGEGHGGCFDGVDDGGFGHGDVPEVGGPGEAHALDAGVVPAEVVEGRILHALRVALVGTGQRL